MLLLLNLTKFVSMFHLLFNRSLLVLSTEQNVFYCLGALWKASLWRLLCIVHFPKGIVLYSLLSKSTF